MDSNEMEAGSDFVQVFADFAANLKFSDLPDSVIKAAQINLYDTLACSIAGRDAPGVKELETLVTHWGGIPQACVLWSDKRLPAPSAAWLNGVMAHARDFDDTHDKAILHAGVSVIPAALAAVEMAGKPVSGEDFLVAVVVGLEFMCRLGVATRIGLIESGFIYSSLMGYFGATVAAARVLNFTPQEMVNAVGIAFSQAAGTHQVTRDAALTKRMQPGFAARAAVTSVAMSQVGIRGAQRSVEGQDGLSRIYLQSAIDPQVLREGLGRQFHMADLAYKPYPCCRFNHAAIDAALQVFGQQDFDWRTVRKVEVGTNHQAWQAVGTPLEIRQSPKTVVQAQFSFCYTVACALVNGRVGLEDFTNEALNRLDVQSVARLVEPFVDEEIEKRWGRNVAPVKLRVHCDDGLHEIWIEHAKGSPDAPMTPADMRSKLVDCLEMSGFESGLAEPFEGFAMELRRSADVAASLKALVATITR